MPAFVERLAERAISRPTAVQCHVIPPLLEEKSIIFRSATGTGKTFAYLLPVLQNLLCGDKGQVPYSGPSLMVCAPTLELCSQIAGEVDFLLNGAGKTALLAGSGG